VIKMVYIGRRLGASGKIVHAYIRFKENGKYDDEVGVSTYLFGKPLDKYMAIGNVIETSNEDGSSTWKVGERVPMLDLPTDHPAIQRWRSAERADVTTKAQRDAAKRHSKEGDTVLEAVAYLNQEYRRLTYAQRAGYLAWIMNEVTR